MMPIRERHSWSRILPSSKATSFAEAVPCRLQLGRATIRPAVYLITSLTKMLSWCKSRTMLCAANSGNETSLA